MSEPQGNKDVQPVKPSSQGWQEKPVTAMLVDCLQEKLLDFQDMVSKVGLSPEPADFARVAHGMSPGELKAAFAMIDILVYLARLGRDGVKADRDRLDALVGEWDGLSEQINQLQSNAQEWLTDKISKADNALHPSS
jgi:hypothetical protein